MTLFSMMTIGNEVHEYVAGKEPIVMSESGASSG
jgi:hypothetical protein